MMGSEEGQSNEKPAHEVQLDSFYMSKFPVTQQLWSHFFEAPPSFFQGENRPVDRVSWEEANAFLEKLTAQAKFYLLGLGLDFVEKSVFRLPTEAEWEYAARGGIFSQGYLYSGSDKLKQVGWYNENSGGSTHEGGKLLANELGLYDMSGNVWEGGFDWATSSYYRECKKLGLVENPVGPLNGIVRSVRGGNYFFDASYCRSIDRNGFQPNTKNEMIGFRIVLGKAIPKVTG